jgi:predicted RNA-binding protein (virulence factor B family)
MSSITIGLMNSLVVFEEFPHGVYLGDAEEKVLLPKKYVTSKMKIGTNVDVFIYMDSEDRPVATTILPRAQAGQFAMMVIKAITAVGAFADWGLEKDLLIPFREQIRPLEEGDEVVVYVYVDDTDRMAGSTKIRHYLMEHTDELVKGQEVEALFYDSNEKGIECIIDGQFRGLLFWNQVFEELAPGDTRRAWIGQVREDGKIDLVIKPPHFILARDLDADKILHVLKADGGYLPLSDSSSPEEIKRVLGMSKKAFKKAVGGLYKSNLIKLDRGGIRLV